MDYLAQFLSLVYGQTTRVPRIVLILATGTVGTFLVQFLHKGMSQKQDPRPKKPLPQHLRKPQPVSTPAQPAAIAATNAAATTTSANTPSPSKPKKRRGKN